MRTPSVSPGSGAEATLQLFRGDPFDRALTWIGLPGRSASDMARRAFGLWLVAFVPLVVASFFEGHLFLPREEGELVFRMSMLADVPVWTQIFFFIPFALFSERFVEGRMYAAIPHLSVLADSGDIPYLSEWATRVARSRWMLVLLVPAFLLPWLWARTEIANDLNTWTSVVVGSGEPAWFSGFLDRTEWFTVAGLWVAFVSLPIFTFLWLRWLWKIAAWTAFLARVSRLRLRLMAVHPDRTGGLGTVSDVQSSFSLILFGTSMLISGFVIFKLKLEGGNQPQTLWIPVIAYGLLAPTVFVAPLFLFTAKLRAARDAARARLQPLVVEVAEAFRDQWLTETEAGTEDLLHTEHTSHLADLHAAHRAVKQMRIVPFDRRSVTELFALAAIPFGVLLFFAKLPSKWDALIQFFG